MHAWAQAALAKAAKAKAKELAPAADGDEDTDASSSGDDETLVSFSPIDPSSSSASASSPFGASAASRPPPPPPLIGYEPLQVPAHEWSDLYTSPWLPPTMNVLPSGAAANADELDEVRARVGRVRMAFWTVVNYCLLSNACIWRDRVAFWNQSKITACNHTLAFLIFCCALLDLHV